MQELELHDHDPYGYLLVHFVENRDDHAEKIYFSLSRGNDPTRWQRLNSGAPLLEWTGGTTGVRDPHIVKGRDGYHIVATDLRMWRPGLGFDLNLYRYRGSRDLVVWDSPDLLTWSEPRSVTVAPDGAGMAWAPEAVWDPIAGDYLVHWSSGLDGGPSQILVSRTRDFQTFTPAEPYLTLPGGVIDMTVVVTDGQVHRFAKHDDGAPNTMQVFHQVGSSFFADDFRTVATHLGHEVGGQVEAPLVFRENGSNRWYLWVDRYGVDPHGYHAFTTTDLGSGDWRAVDHQSFDLEPNTKHGAVLPLTRREHVALASGFHRGGVSVGG